MGGITKGWGIASQQFVYSGQSCVVSRIGAKKTITHSLCPRSAKIEGLQQRGHSEAKETILKKRKSSSKREYF
jgi:hypothetical protein